MAGGRFSGGEWCGGGTREAQRSLLSFPLWGRNSRAAQRTHKHTINPLPNRPFLSPQKARIRAGDYVRKVAVHRGRVAVQLPGRVALYELEGGGGGGNGDSACGDGDYSGDDQRGGGGGDEGEEEGGCGGDEAGTSAADGGKDAAEGGGGGDASELRYRLVATVGAAAWAECNLLVLTGGHLVLCQDRRLQLYDFSGAWLREWRLDAVVRYIKVAGGPVGREALLVGLKSGQVWLGVGVGARSKL